MNDNQVDAVIEFALKRRSEKDLVTTLGINPASESDFIQREIVGASDRKSADVLEAVLILAFHFGASADLAVILCRLLVEDWHRSHENIALLLQQLRDPETVDCLYRCAQMQLDYLAFDDNYALAVKCVWALHDIGTPEAIGKLLLLVEDERQAVRDNARARLDELSREHRAR